MKLIRDISLYEFAVEFV